MTYSTHNDPTNSLPSEDKTVHKWNLHCEMDSPESMNHFGLLGSPVIGWAASECTIEQRKAHCELLIALGFSHQEAIEVAYAEDWKSPFSLVNVSETHLGDIGFNKTFWDTLTEHNKIIIIGDAPSICILG